MLTLGSDVSSSIRDLTKSRLDIFEENMTEEEKQNRRNWRQPGQANPESKGLKRESMNSGPQIGPLAEAMPPQPPPTQPNPALIHQQLA
ncbi:hypothetical protein KEM48_014028 [Puccinia striiformis f. sp. tritici PST-130]|uniref:Uncharacterized protein n=1 Tax=Puccinia striiformis f. sp. tritici PST-78 TaxID=1165861 RepID=A0A0L0VGY0_9BASI|nr:hypothetical protein KEM48_014028 [Puccinia striiformis f. sp. tritici PST-130]KNE98503.1 hypothetical protein PSTG_08242 [Puccinia striiformis f. sp. tritici PST-78]